MPRSFPFLPTALLRNRHNHAEKQIASHFKLETRVLAGLVHLQSSQRATHLRKL